MYQYIVSRVVICLYQRLQGSAPVPKRSTRADRIGAPTSLIPCCLDLLSGTKFRTSILSLISLTEWLS
jgi:hypothetical protein